jgi:hypothetical protein
MVGVKTPVYRRAIQRYDARQGNDCLFDAVDDMASQSVFDHFLDRTATHRQHRRAAGHRLNHGETVLALFSDNKSPKW